jgi:two-component system response regulator FixJ
LQQTVYIVDDDEAVRDSARAVLESHLFEVEDFASGAAFLDRCRANGVEGCLVLDINMPGVDGFGVLRQLHAPRPELPVVVITARADSTTEARVRAAGAAALVEKPFAGDQLIDAVRKAIDNRS